MDYLELGIGLFILFLLFRAFQRAVVWLLGPQSGDVLSVEQQDALSAMLVEVRDAPEPLVALERALLAVRQTGQIPRLADEVAATEATPISAPPVRPPATAPQTSTVVAPHPLQPAAASPPATVPAKPRVTVPQTVQEVPLPRKPAPVVAETRPPAAPARARPRVRVRLPSLSAIRINWGAATNATLLLYLGAALVVISAGVFVGSSWEAISGLARWGVLAGFAAAFLLSGAAIQRVELLSQAGRTFWSVGLLLTPFVVLAYDRFVLLGDATALFWGATSSALVLLYYGIFLRVDRTRLPITLAALTLGVQAMLLPALLGLESTWRAPVMMVLAGALLAIVRRSEPSYLRLYAGLRRRTLPVLAETHLLVAALLVLVAWGIFFSQITAGPSAMSTAFLTLQLLMLAYASEWTRHPLPLYATVLLAGAVILDAAMWLRPANVSFFIALGVGWTTMAWLLLFATPMLGRRVRGVEKRLYLIALLYGSLPLAAAAASRTATEELFFFAAAFGAALLYLAMSRRLQLETLLWLGMGMLNLSLIFLSNSDFLGSVPLGLTSGSLGLSLIWLIAEPRVPGWASRFRRQAFPLQAAATTVLGAAAVGMVRSEAAIVAGVLMVPVWLYWAYVHRSSAGVVAGALQCSIAALVLVWVLELPVIVLPAALLTIGALPSVLRSRLVPSERLGADWTFHLVSLAPLAALVAAANNTSPLFGMRVGLGEIQTAQLFLGLVALFYTWQAMKRKSELLAMVPLLSACAMALWGGMDYAPVLLPLIAVAAGGGMLALAPRMPGRSAEVWQAVGLLVALIAPVFYLVPTAGASLQGLDAEFIGQAALAMAVLLYGWQGLKRQSGPLAVLALLETYALAFWGGVDYAPVLLPLIAVALGAGTLVLAPPVPGRLGDVSRSLRVAGIPADTVAKYTTIPFGHVWRALGLLVALGAPVLYVVPAAGATLGSLDAEFIGQLSLGLVALLYLWQALTHDSGPLAIAALLEGYALAFWGGAAYEPLLLPLVAVALGAGTLVLAPRVPRRLGDVSRSLRVAGIPSDAANLNGTITYGQVWRGLGLVVALVAPVLYLVPTAGATLRGLDAEFIGQLSLGLVALLYMWQALTHSSGLLSIAALLETYALAFWGGVDYAPVLLPLIAVALGAGTLVLAPRVPGITSGLAEKYGTISYGHVWWALGLQVALVAPALYLVSILGVRQGGLDAEFIGQLSLGLVALLYMWQARTHDNGLLSLAALVEAYVLAFWGGAAYEPLLLPLIAVALGAGTLVLAPRVPGRLGDVSRSLRVAGIPSDAANLNGTITYGQVWRGLGLVVALVAPVLYLVPTAGATLRGLDAEFIGQLSLGLAALLYMWQARTHDSAPLAIVALLEAYVLAFWGGVDYAPVLLPLIAVALGAGTLFVSPRVPGMSAEATQKYGAISFGQLWRGLALVVALVAPVLYVVPAAGATLGSLNAEFIGQLSLGLTALLYMWQARAHSSELLALAALLEGYGLAFWGGFDYAPALLPLIAVALGSVTLVIAPRMPGRSRELLPALGLAAAIMAPALYVVPSRGEPLLGMDAVISGQIALLLGAAVVGFYGRVANWRPLVVVSGVQFFGLYGWVASQNGLTEIQLFSAPLALLAAAVILVYPEYRDTLELSAVAILLVPAVAQAFSGISLMYSLLLLGWGILLLGVGISLERRTLLVAGSASLLLAAVRQLWAVATTLPPGGIIALVGVLLMVAALILTLGREGVQRLVGRGNDRWRHMTSRFH